MQATPANRHGTDPSRPAVPAGWEGILAPGETILWQGAPRPGVVWADLIDIKTLFGAFFTGFAVFWTSVAATMSASFPGPMGGIFPLFGLPFVLVGLHLMAGRIFWDALQRRGLFYTLTDQAAYIAANMLGRRTLQRYAVEPDMVIGLEDGVPGSVWFAEKIIHHRGGRSGSGSMRTYRPPRTERVPIGFRRIDAARAVYRQLTDLRDARRQAGDPGQS